MVEASAESAVDGHRPGTRRALIRELRPHQWAKNVLVVVPLLASHRFVEPRAIVVTALAFVAICLVASATYIWNDLSDLELDRAHPTKKNRPLASGMLAIRTAVLTSVVLLVIGLGIAWSAGFWLLVAMLCYLGLTVLYTRLLKRIALLDVVVLALLYTLRIIAGTVAIGSPLSIWLAAFSLFVFFSLALLKRYSDFRNHDSDVIAGRGYHKVDSHVVLALGAGSGLVATLVATLYVNSDAMIAIYQAPIWLWGAIPLLLFWTGRLWLLAGRGLIDDDPVIFVIRDRPSIAVWIAIVLLGVLAAVIPTG